MNEVVMENIIRPAVTTIKGYFPMALMILTLFCLAYAGYLAARYYFARNDEAKKARAVNLLHMGARSIITMYIAFIAIRIAFAMFVRMVGV